MWWCWLLGGLPALLLLGVVGPLRQNTAYHRFADTRSCCGVPNLMDVASNAGFAAVGCWGLASVPRRSPTFVVWTVFFAGVALVAAGSAYYHWDPSNRRLVWDRLPMTVGFMSLFTAVLYDCTDLPAAWLHPLLAGLVALGAWSVLYWHQKDDLRPYLVVQYYPLLCMALLLPSHENTEDRALYGGMLGWYLLAKAAEALDRPIYRWTRRAVSGHTLKHLLATVATAWAVRTGCSTWAPPL
jgi:hypothetical protein